MSKETYFSQKSHDRHELVFSWQDLIERAVHAAGKRCRKRPIFTQKRPILNLKETCINTLYVKEHAVFAAGKRCRKRPIFTQKRPILI